MKTKPETPEEKQARALDFIRGKSRPVLIGEVAIYLGPYCSLKAAEDIVMKLLDESLIRPLTPAESRQFDTKSGYLPV